MPQHRQVRRRRKRVVKKSSLNNKQLTRRVKKLEKAPEVKYEFNYDTAAWTTAGRLFACSTLAQGNNYNQRIGEEVLYLKTVVKLHISLIPTIGINRIRIIGFYMNDSYGTAPVLFGPSAIAMLDDSVITSNTLAPQNPRMTDKYKIVYDKLITLNAPDPTVQHGRTFMKTFNHNKMRVKYLDSGGTLASLSGKSFWFTCIPNTQATGDVIPIVTWTSYYTDA